MCERARSFFLEGSSLAPLAVLGKSNGPATMIATKSFDIFMALPLSKQTNLLSICQPPLLVRPLSRGARAQIRRVPWEFAPRRFPPRPDLLQNQKAHQRTFDDCASHRHHPGDPSTKIR